MATLAQKLQTAAKRFNSIACFGMDPVPTRMPQSHSEGICFAEFYTEIIREMSRQGAYPGAVKPNEGFFNRYDAIGGDLDFDGSRDLAAIIQAARTAELPVIFDAKRGDIGPSSENYARELENVWKADAITISPYLGTDSVEPFLRLGAAYVLCRTSNPGGKELQNLLTLSKEDIDRCLQFVRDNGDQGSKMGLYDQDQLSTILTTSKPVYIRVAQKIVDWDAISPGNVGAVVGATNMDELKDIAHYFVQSGKRIPLLIPGVSKKQGGSARDVVTALRDAGYDLSIVRISNSSDLNFAWEKEGNPADYAGASVRALKQLNEEIGYTP